MKISVRVLVPAVVMSVLGCGGGDDGGGASGGAGAGGTSATGGVGAGGVGASSGASAATGGATAGGSSATGGQTSAGGATGGGGGSATGFKSAFSATSTALDCNDTAAQALARGAPSVTFGTSTVIVGYQQIGAADQDPIVARYDGDTKVFCEHSKKGGGIDARAYGVTWDGASKLYVVYTVVGGGTTFDGPAAGGWQPSYGDGGASAKVSVIGSLDATTGVVTKATYVSSKLTKNGKLATNTHTPADAIRVQVDGSLEFAGKPAYCTLNPDKSSMCDPAKMDYPQDYRARFSPDLSSMSCASASGVSFVTQPCP
jgi:hypothetical protein